MYSQTKAMSANLHIEDYQRKPFPFIVFVSIREIYSSLADFLSTIGEVVLAIILILIAPVWATVLFFLLIWARVKSARRFKVMRAKWQDAEKSAEMFDALEFIVRFKQIVERENGEFRMPKRFWYVRPFFKEVRRFHTLYHKQAEWLEAKLYPTAEELGIPQEDIEFMKSQMTEEDYKDLRDPDWIPFEKECLLN